MVGEGGNDNDNAVDLRDRLDDADIDLARLNAADGRGRFVERELRGGFELEDEEDEDDDDEDVEDEVVGVDEGVAVEVVTVSEDDDDDFSVGVECFFQNFSFNISSLFVEDSCGTRGVIGVTGVMRLMNADCVETRGSVI